MIITTTIAEKSYKLIDKTGLQRGTLRAIYYTKK